MTIREKLIRAGLWYADDPRDPSTDDSTIKDLERTVRTQIGDGYRFLADQPDSADVESVTVSVYSYNALMFAVTEHTRGLAFCDAVLRLDEMRSGYTRE